MPDLDFWRTFGVVFDYTMDACMGQPGYWDELKGMGSGVVRSRGGLCLPKVVLLLQLLVQLALGRVLQDQEHPLLLTCTRQSISA